MNTADLPIHVQMLMALRAKVQTRQREHEAKTGMGLEDQVYQRHVGRIAECKVQIELINEMMRADLDDVSDFLENEKSERSQDQRPSKGNRTGKRRAATAADH
jgi:hypothetical protein